MMSKQDYFDQLIKEEHSTRQKLFYSAIFLFSEKGYANLGIRELCRYVNIKESSFYNHYRSKEDLFQAILNYYKDTNRQVAYSEDEILSAVTTGDIRLFFEQNMQKFAGAAGSRLYHTTLQIIKMEAFVRPEIKEIALQNLYYLRKDYTEQVLTGLMNKGCIKTCDVKTVTAEYYYALMGLLEEYVLIENWNEGMESINRKIAAHIDFFVKLLQN